jgi:hypothetical protein
MENPEALDRYEDPHAATPINPEKGASVEGIAPPEDPPEVNRPGDP